VRIAQPVRRRPGSLDDVLSPLETDVFLEKWWGRSFLHVHGSPDKFDRLISWRDLGRMLEQHRMRPPRLVLAKMGRDVDARRYLEADPGWPEPRLKGHELLAELGEGASLIVNYVDDFHTPIRDLARSLEWRLNAPVHANLYAAWRGDNGFNLHWDDQEAIILQVTGKKHWKIWPPTRLHPLKKDSEEAVLPGGEPVWDHILEPGDTLYLPRGWWHVVYPLDEPTLHLTITAVTANGIDLLHWFVNRLKGHVDCRMDVPHLNDAERQQHYLGALEQCMQNEFNRDIFPEFLQWQELKSNRRPVFNFPLVPKTSAVELSAETMVRLMTSRRLRFRDISGDEIHFDANGKSWTVPPSMRQALDLLNDGNDHYVGELIRGAEDDDSCRSTLDSLAKQGLLEIVNAAQ
jgi:ribosomal protein L16 Arg81 hydroxylase